MEHGKVTSLGHTLGHFNSVRIFWRHSRCVLKLWDSRWNRIKFSPAGNLISSTTYVSGSLYFTSIAIDENDNTYLSGYWYGNTVIGQYSSEYITQFLVMKINNSGSVDWVQTPNIHRAQIGYGI